MQHECNMESDCLSHLPTDRQSIPALSRASRVGVSPYYFFIIVAVIRHKTTATAGRASLLVVRAFFNDAVAVAVRTSFHVRPHQSRFMSTRPNAVFAELFSRSLNLVVDDLSAFGERLGRG